MRQYGYPLGLQKLATDTVLQQAEALAEFGVIENVKNNLVNLFPATRAKFSFSDELIKYYFISCEK
ncbi:hypothetical protein [Sunxiuqinia rutila]|uniref:hypothetical protein n=1 Tax=Sunxiuqinia rutila TaxID=1397841 RepID=UPI003D36E5A0